MLMPGKLYKVLQEFFSRPCSSDEDYIEQARNRVASPNGKPYVSSVSRGEIVMIVEHAMFCCDGEDFLVVKFLKENGIAYSTYGRITNLEKQVNSVFEQVI